MLCRSFKVLLIPWNALYHTASCIYQRRNACCMINVIITVQEALEVKTSELASQRIAFEEEKLAQQTADIKVEDSEAEQLRLKLKEQVFTVQY